MSSFPSRALEVWKSSLAESMAPIRGVFSFEVAQTVMVPQTLQFLCEYGRHSVQGIGDVLRGFLFGMHYANPNNPGSLLYQKHFENATDLFSFDLQILSDAISQLELHTDINLTFARVVYLADVGSGPNLPLLIIQRLPFVRGVGFEVEERGTVGESMRLGDFNLVDKVRVAQQHYSTGMALLAGEDAVSGLIDAAFTQFYLSIEAALECHERDEALTQGARFFREQFDENFGKIVSHVYLARHRFFGHAHPKYRKGLLDTETAFDIAKQALVARWTARRLS
jgi:hypothetical protein